jgi:hypothetical protein
MSDYKGAALNALSYQSSAEVRLRFRNPFAVREQRGKMPLLAPRAPQ